MSASSSSTSSPAHRPSSKYTPYASSMPSSTNHPRHPHNLPSKYPASNLATSSAANPAFGSAARDRQSRGRDPYFSDDGSDGSMVSDRGGSGGSSSKFRLGGNAEKEDFAKKERREKAVAYLDSPEMLMMYAQSKSISIPAARLHFMKAMCGYDSESLSEAPAVSSHHHSPYTRNTDKRRGGDRASASGR